MCIFKTHQPLKRDLEEKSNTVQSKLVVNFSQSSSIDTDQVKNIFLGFLDIINTCDCLSNIYSICDTRSHSERHGTNREPSEEYLEPLCSNALYQRSSAHVVVIINLHSFKRLDKTHLGKQWPLNQNRLLEHFVRYLQFLATTGPDSFAQFPFECRGREALLIPPSNLISKLCV